MNAAVAEATQYAAVANAKATYMTSMEAACGGNKLVELVDLLKQHDLCSTAAIRQFAQAAHSYHHLQLLEKEIAGAYAGFAMESEHKLAKATVSHLVAVSEARKLYVGRMKELCTMQASLMNDQFRKGHQYCRAATISHYTTATAKLGNTQQLTHQYREQLEKEIADSYECLEMAIFGASNQSAVANAKAAYVRGMKNAVPASENALHREHIRHAAEAIRLFKAARKTNDAELSTTYLEQLRREINEAFANFEKEATAESNRVALVNAVDAYEREMKVAWLKGHESKMNHIELEVNHEICKTEAIYQFKKAEKMGSWEYSQEYLQQLEKAIADSYEGFQKMRGESCQQRPLYEHGPMNAGPSGNVESTGTNVINPEMEDSNDEVEDSNNEVDYSNDKVEDSNDEVEDYEIITVSNNDDWE